MSIKSKSDLMPFVYVLLVVILFSGIKILRYSPDSADYIAAARSFLESGTFVGYNGSPYYLQPPLFPKVLSVFILLFNGNFWQAALFLNCFCLAMLVFLFSRWAYKNFKSGPANLSTLALILSIPLFEVFSYIWSEPFFILLFFLFFLSWESFLKKPVIKNLVLPALACSLLLITRNAAITIWFSSILIIFFCIKENFWTRLKMILFFSTVAFSFSLLWMVRNILVVNKYYGFAQSDRNFYDNLSDFWNTFLNWFIPFGLNNRILVLLLTAGFIGILTGLLIKKIRSNDPRASFLILFVLSYSFFIVAFASLWRIDRLQNRFLSPLFLPLLILFGIFFDRVFQNHLPRKIKIPAIILFAGVFLLQPVLFDFQNFIKVREFFEKHKKLAESELVFYLKAVAADIQNKKIKVFSNNVSIVYLFSGINCSAFRVNEDIPKEEEILYVHFDEKKNSRRFLKLKDLNRYFKLNELFRFDFAVIYVLEPKEVDFEL